MDTLIIAFGHKARNGKGSACQAILEAHGQTYDIRKYSFADALKEEVNAAAVEHGGMLALFTHLAQHSNLPKWVTYEPSPDMTDPRCLLGKQRTLLQWWGTEYRRAEDSFYWVKALRKRIMEEKPQIALIDDMRFLNEMAWVKSDPSNRTVRLDRLGFVGIATSSHTSENELDNAAYDYTIQVHDGDLDELKKDALFVFDHIIEQMTPPENLDFPEGQITEYTIDESKERPTA
jgi:hypothetical protein